MFRTLTAIEIAEGALLADIAVVFQFVALFIPVGTSLFYTLNIIVFTVLVLRRGIYVALMGFVVTICLVCMVMGPQNLMTMAAECMSGIFLGVAMKRRWPHLLLLFVGILGGTLFLYGIFLFYSFLAGFSVSQYVQLLQQAYNALTALISFVCMCVGLGVWWHQSALPWLQPWSRVAFTYWWLTFFCVYLIFACPMVGMIYWMTNFFVRRLGYDVRPFPAHGSGTLLHGLVRRYRQSRRRIRARALRRVV
jgi:hypothetical protein